MEWSRNLLNHLRNKLCHTFPIGSPKTAWRINNVPVLLDETVLGHWVQFWITFPAKNKKKESTEYFQLWGCFKLLTNPKNIVTTICCLAYHTISICNGSMIDNVLKVCTHLEISLCARLVNFYQVVSANWQAFWFSPLFLQFRNPFSLHLALIFSILWWYSVNFQWIPSR